MGEHLEIAFAGKDGAAFTVILHGSWEAVKTAAQLFGEPVALVPTEGPAFDVLADAIYANLPRNPHRLDVDTALRAALTGDAHHG